MAEKMTETNGGQSRNPDLNLDGHPVDTSSRMRFDSVGEPANNLEQAIVEQFRVWYCPGSEIAQAIEARASLSIAGYFHTVRLQALNFALPEASIIVDENSTLIQIGLLLHTPEERELPVVLEETSGPFPKWGVPRIDSKIKGGIQRVYVADITEPFTLALVRDVGGDFPLLIRLELLNDGPKTIGDLVRSLLPERAKERVSVKLHAKLEERVWLEDIQEMLCGQFQTVVKDKELYSTTIFVLLTDSPEEYRFHYDYDCPSPLPLKVAFLHCLSIVDIACKLEAFPLQSIHLSQALLHLIVCLAEADRSEMEESVEVYYISRLNDLVAKLQSILASEPSTLTPKSLKDFFEEICDEHPGVVAVRQSFECFEALAELDNGTSSEGLDTDVMSPGTISQQDLGLGRDANPGTAPEIESAASVEGYL